MSGIFILIVGPSGSGKDTLLDHVCKEFPNLLYVPSYSSRTQRRGESQGDPYNFISREEFEDMIKNGAFLEWAEYAGNLYGTARKEIYEALEEGVVVIKEAEVQGARILLERIPRKNIFIIFISAGSWEDLEKRIRGRGSITEEAIARRKERFRDEMTFIDQADAVVENKNGRLEDAKRAIEEIIEKVRASRV